jgi:hypothetical protein
MLVLLCAPAQSHQSSDSYLDISISADGTLTSRWDIALRDLDVLLPIDANNDRQLTWGEVQAASAPIHALARSALALRRGAKVCTFTDDPHPIAIDSHTDGLYAVLTLQGSCIESGPLSIDYSLLLHVDAGHRGLLHLRDGTSEQTLILVPGKAQKIAPGQALQNWLGYVREGIHHIATGYDHLLFLLSLLLPVALARSASTADPHRPLRDTVVLVTAFTVAHSLTLALATFQVVHPSTRLVESAIAASVVVAALHNLFHHKSRSRWLLAFAFGLIHGFGFAAMLQGLPSSLGARLLALAGFNLGVELGQLLAVAIFLPLALWIARGHREHYQRWALHGGSLAIAALGLVWLYQRVFDVTIIAG